MDVFKKLAEDICLLSEFRINPKIIFVVVLQDKCYISFGCIRQTCTDALGSEFYPVWNRYLRATLTRKHPAIGTPPGMGHVDPFFLLLDFGDAECFVRVCKVWGAAHHRDDLPLF